VVAAVDDLRALNNQLKQAIKRGLGMNDPGRTWIRLKKELGKDCISSADEVIHGIDILTELQAGSLEEEIQTMIDLCSDRDNGLFFLKNACRCFRSSILRKEAESSLQAYARILPNQLLFRTDCAPIISQSDHKLIWINDLDHADIDKAKRVAEDMFRQAIPVDSRNRLDQFLSSATPHESKVCLERLLSGVSPFEADKFEQQIKMTQPVNDQYDITQFLYIIVEEDDANETEYQFKAELIDQGLPRLTDLDLKREENGSWMKGSKDQLIPYILSLHNIVNQRMVCKLSVEIFLPGRLLAELEYEDLYEFIENDQNDVPTLCKRKNIVFKLPFVFRSLERARRAPRSELGPLLRKWRSLNQGVSVLHPLKDHSQSNQNSFDAKLLQDNTGGLLILSNLMNLRTSLFQQIIDSGTWLVAWWLHDPPGDDGIPQYANTSLRLNCIDRCLDLGGPRYNDIGDIVAPGHLLQAETTAYNRFALASQTDYVNWIDRLMILHDHPDRWPRLFFDEQELGGRLQSSY
jgi:hypothetical protein